MFDPCYDKLAVLAIFDSIIEYIIEVTQVGIYTVNTLTRKSTCT